ncbi:uncharacterized protein LOC126314415 [Schistocerca gregaria]|uniref:uncharacterized protein LOC126314415 n=1 Tax=Schistocerca gregaria TaxID=7010 RepID=UPI00211EAF46|nr:uncharacterized protein LOC126314415 [Schistocerca gregaria]
MCLRFYLVSFMSSFSKDSDSGDSYKKFSRHRHSLDPKYIESLGQNERYTSSNYRRSSIGVPSRIHTHTSFRPTNIRTDISSSYRSDPLENRYNYVSDIRRASYSPSSYSPASNVSSRSSIPPSSRNTNYSSSIGIGSILRSQIPDRQSERELKASQRAFQAQIREWKNFWSSVSRCELEHEKQAQIACRKQERFEEACRDQLEQCERDWNKKLENAKIQEAEREERRNLAALKNRANLERRLKTYEQNAAERLKLLIEKHTLNLDKRLNSLKNAREEHARLESEFNDADRYSRYLDLHWYAYQMRWAN